MNLQNSTELRAAYERIAELESVLTLIRDGLADTALCQKVAA